MADNDQTFIIPLDSPLEVSQEDTVVPSQKPTFTSNCQQVASSLLSNSIKWERDGWFIGWNGYNINASLKGEVQTVPDDLGNIQTIILNDGVYIISYELIEQFTVNFDGKLLSTQFGTINSYTRNGFFLHFVGTTTGGNPATIDIDTRNMTGVHSLNHDLYNFTLTGNNVYQVALNRKSSVNDRFTYRPGTISSEEIILNVVDTDTNYDVNIFGLEYHPSDISTITGNIEVNGTPGYINVSPSIPLQIVSSNRTGIGSVDEVDHVMAIDTEDRTITAKYLIKNIGWAFLAGSSVKYGGDEQETDILFDGYVPVSHEGPLQRNINIGHPEWEDGYCEWVLRNADGYLTMFDWDVTIVYHGSQKLNLWVDRHLVTATFNGPAPLDVSADGLYYVCWPDGTRIVPGSSWYGWTDGAGLPGSGQHTINFPIPCHIIGPTIPTVATGPVVPLNFVLTGTYVQNIIVNWPILRSIEDYYGKFTNSYMRDRITASLGTLLGEFDTYTDLMAFSLPTSAVENDYAIVKEDETHDDMQTRYILTSVVPVVWAYYTPSNNTIGISFPRGPAASMIKSTCESFYPANMWRHEIGYMAGYLPLIDIITKEYATIDAYASGGGIYGQNVTDFSTLVRYKTLKMDAPQLLVSGLYVQYVIGYNGHIIKTGYVAKQGYLITSFDMPMINGMLDVSWSTNVEITQMVITDFPRQQIIVSLQRKNQVSRYIIDIAIHLGGGKNFMVGHTVINPNPAMLQVRLVSAVVKTLATDQVEGDIAFVFKNDAAYLMLVKRWLILNMSGFMTGSTLVSVVDNTAVAINIPVYGLKTFRYDGTIMYSDDELLNIEDNNMVCFMAIRDDLVFRFTVIGSYYSNLEYISSSTGPNSITFIVNGVEHTLTLGDNTYTVLNVTETNMRTLKTRSIGEIEDIGRIICRSAWADTEVEKYWYVDAETIMVVRYMTIELLKKTTEYDIKQPWKWEVAASVPYSVWFTDEWKKYFCSDSKEQVPYVFRVVGDTDNITITYTKAPQTIAELQNPVWRTITVPVVQLGYGSPVRTNAISMYEPVMLGDIIVNQMDLSATVIDDHLLIGMFVAKGLKQWVVKIRLEDRQVEVITGYGYVGVNGHATGGQIPSYACGNTGFNSVVKALDTAAANKFDIYGSTDAIYFYVANTSGIVTHLQWNAGAYSTVRVNLTNRSYLSTSKTTFTDNYRVMGVQAAVLPMPYIMNVLVAKAGAGCLATASTWMTRIAASDIISFTLKTDAQASTSSSISGFFLALALCAIGGAGMVMKQEMPKAGGLIDMAMDLAAGKFNLFGNCTAVAYPIATTLSMMDVYSIGNDSAVFAGPGYVSHQFIQSHWVGGLANGEVSSKGKGIGVGPPLPIPGIIGGLVAGMPSITDMNPSSGIQPFDRGDDNARGDKRIPFGRLGWRHLYLNWPASGADNNLIHETTIQGSLPNTFVIRGRDIQLDSPDLVIDVQSKTINLPQGYAVVDGCSNILEKADFFGTKRVEYPIFSEPYNYDFCIDEETGLYYTGFEGGASDTSVDDTKVLDGQPTNVVIKDRYLYIASSYTALEVLPKGKFDLKLLRPWAVTAAVLGINLTKLNCVYNSELLHAFDGYSNRIISLHGSEGVDIELLNVCFSYVVSGPLKVTTIFPPAAYMGKFVSNPVFKYDYPVDVLLQEQVLQKKVFASKDVFAENRNGYRYSLPIIYDRLALLPAAMKTVAAYKHNVVDGITSLTTDMRMSNPLLRRPKSLDFAIYGQIYRWNEEYVSKITSAFGVQDIRDIVATLGLDYVGSTPEVAWFYSPAIRAFYNFSGANTIKKLFYAFRFRDVNYATWDFVSQEVVFRSATDKGVMLPRVEKDFLGEIYPISPVLGPTEFYSMAGGLVFQGVRRFQVNRFLLLDEMINTLGNPALVIDSQRGKWDKVPIWDIDDFWKMRDYNWDFNFDPAPHQAVDGYFIEPFRLATAYLGIDDKTECQFEWEINFALTEIMDKVIKDYYVTVCLAAETITVGGVKRSEVTHVRLRKDMFTRRNNYGYYSFRFTSNNGAGNSERLFIWSDGLIALRSLNQIAKSITTTRTAPLLTAPDFANDTEY